MNPFELLVLAVALLLIGLVPITIAFHRRHHQRWAIFWLMVLVVWWMPLVWLVAFVWSVSAIRKPA